MSRRLLLRLVQVLVTLAAFAWLSTRLSVDELGAAFAALPAGALALAIAAWLCAFAVAVARWLWMMRAYGSTAPLPLSWVLRVYWAGMFYNSWAPGGLGGDVVRGLASRQAFADRPAAATAGFAVTGVDRMIGLAGLMLLVGGALSLWPVPGTEGIRPLAALATLAALGGVALVAVARRAGPLLPAVVGRRLAALPPLARPELLALSVLASVATHLLTALAGYAIVRGLVPEARLTDALVFVPLSMATIYLPISVGGAGVREAAFAGLYATVGVAEQVAVAASLAMFGIQLGVSAGGGLLQLLWPIEE